MKNFKLILLVAFSISIFSCSSEDSPDVILPAPINEYFTFTNDGQVLQVSSWQAYKSENTLAVSGTTTNGMSIDFEFNAQGNLGDASTFISDFSAPNRHSQAYYSEESFTFELVALNETNKTVEVNYSGKVYEDEYDLTSPFVLVSGSFLLKYTVITPSVSGLWLNTKIDNVDWYSSTEDQEGGFFPGTDIRLNFYNSDKNNIAIIVNHNTTVATSYNFTSSAVKNKAILSVYNPSLDYHEDYNCTGNLTITTKDVGPQITVIGGTFSFTATNPSNSNQTQVTNGTFKTAYSNY